MKEYITYTDHIFQNIKSPEQIVNWRVRKEPIYRLLDNRQWLDNFFSSGELALSCFSKFKNYPDEIRGDRNEGNAMIWFDDADGNTFAYKYESGMNSYILCTTLELTPEVIKDFNAVGAIKIHNPTYFGAEITKVIPGCLQGVEGKCAYEDSRVYKGFSTKINSILNSKNYIDPLLKNELINATNEKELFLKLDKYKSQNEYRMLWFVENPVENTLFVKCPDAIRFCERINF